MVASTNAFAAAPQGQLTAQEYQLLHTAQARLKALGADSESAISRSRRVCGALRQVTPLLRAAKADCLAFAAFAIDTLRADTAAAHCTATGSTISQMDHCMLPSFTAYRASTRVYYLADRHVDQAAHSRGFSNRCVAVLGNSESIVTAEGRLATDLGAMVSALRRSSTSALQSAARRVDSDANRLRGSSGSLALCPHQ